MVDCHVLAWKSGLPERSHLGSLAGLLSKDEINRADKFRTGELRNRYIASQGGLRAVLGELLRIDARALQFAGSTPSKPSLRSADFLQFNLSHSADVTLLALTLHVPVGIDIEMVNEPIDQAAARTFLNDLEYAELLRKCDSPALRTAIHQMWVRKEAVLKLLGLGLSEDPKALHVQEICPGQFKVGHCTGESWMSGRLGATRIFDMPSDRGTVAAIAVASGQEPFTIAPVVWIDLPSLAAGLHTNCAARHHRELTVPLLDARIRKLAATFGAVSDDRCRERQVRRHG